MGRKGGDYIRWCSAYLELSSNRAVVAECFNHGGLQAEIPGGARLIDASDETELGRELLAALAACRWETSFNYRNSKKSDWPAFQASGESSMSRFEQRWRRFRVAGANASNIMWQLSVVLKEDPSLTLTATVGQMNDPTRLGHALRYLNTEAARYLELGSP